MKGDQVRTEAQDSQFLEEAYFHYKELSLTYSNFLLQYFSLGSSKLYIILLKGIMEPL